MQMVQTDILNPFMYSCYLDFLYCSSMTLLLSSCQYHLLIGKFLLEFLGCSDVFNLGSIGADNQCFKT